MSETEIQNLITFDPFADAEEPDNLTQAQAAGGTKPKSTKIHIRVQQRNGRKTVTTVQGLDKKFPNTPDSKKSEAKGTSSKGTTKKTKKDGSEKKSKKAEVPTIDSILGKLRKSLACNGHVVNDELAGDVIQLQGDHRKYIYAYLTNPPDDEELPGLGLKPEEVEQHGA